MSFWKELSRRNVVKVGIAYAVAAWLIIHPVDIIFPILHLPEWSITLVAALLIIAFPFVLIFSWIYEVTPKGLKKTKDVPLSKSIAQTTGRRLNYLLAGLLIVAIGLIIFDKFYLDRNASKTKQVPAVSTAAKAKKSIAVLPFTNMSGDKEQESFVDGLSEEMINTITQIPDLRVIARTSCFVFKDSDKTVQEIAKALDVEYILEGSVRKAENELRITAQLISAADESHLWSKTYDKQLKDIFTIQENIATTVANELKATLGISNSLKQLGGTDNEKAYEQYLIAKGQINYNLALKSIDTAIALDPKFALAWAWKAQIHWSIAIFGPANQAASEKESGLSAALKAIELEPNLGQAYLSLGVLKMVKGKFIEAELAFQKGVGLTTETINYSDFGFDRHYSVVGNLKKYNEILDEDRRKDPLNQSTRMWYIFSLMLLGDTRRVEEEIEGAKALFGNEWGLGDSTPTNIYLAAGDVTPLDKMSYSNRIYNSAKKYLHSPKEGLEDLHQIYNENENLSSADFMYISAWAAFFGDPSFAMQAAEKGVSIESSGLFFVWCPVMKDVRKLPRFKKYVKEIGLVDYWNKFGWPDLCHKLDNGDFECD
jgi:TolB-like protein